MRKCLSNRGAFGARTGKSVSIIKKKNVRARRERRDGDRRGAGIGATFTAALQNACRSGRVLFSIVGRKEQTHSFSSPGFGSRAVALPPSTPAFVLGCFVVLP